MLEFTGKLRRCCSLDETRNYFSAYSYSKSIACHWVDDPVSHGFRATVTKSDSLQPYKVSSDMCRQRSILLPSEIIIVFS